MQLTSVGRYKTIIHHFIIITNTFIYDLGYGGGEAREYLGSVRAWSAGEMNALEAFQKAQMAKAKLNKKMAANEENREQHFCELKNWLKEKNDKMMAAMEAKKVKPLRPPIVKEQSN